MAHRVRRPARAIEAQEAEQKCERFVHFRRLLWSGLLRHRLLDDEQCAPAVGTLHQRHRGSFEQGEEFLVIHTVYHDWRGLGW